MSNSSFQLNGHTICLYRHGDSGPLLIEPVAPSSSEDAKAQYDALLKSKGGIPHFTLVTFTVDKWNRDLSPWNAPPVFGDEAFGDGAQDTLSFVINELIPELAARGIKGPCYLGGYSLGGLFSLWSGAHTDRLAGVAAVSPSVWFPGWDTYCENTDILSPAVYLSLGRKEENARHPALSCVGDRIRQQYRRLSQSPHVKRFLLEWNPGTHYTQPPARVARGFQWLLREGSPSE